MNSPYTFTHNKESYMVDWEEDEKVLKLSFYKDTTLLHVKDVKLLGVIDQSQLDQIVKDYWNSFKRNFLLM